MKSYFIAGTGTGVGKTLLTCALTHQLKKRGRIVRAVKPVISGYRAHEAAESDTGLLLAAQGLEVSPETVEAVSPWRFVAPVSPDMAAEDEGRAVGLDALIAFCKNRKADYLLIESAGGILSPLNRHHTMLDWAIALACPVVLVAGSYLGTLSHTLASAHAIGAAGLTLEAVVVSESESSPVPLSRTMATLKRFLPQGARCLAISRLDSSARLWKDVPDMTAIFL